MTIYTATSVLGHSLFARFFSYDDISPTLLITFEYFALSGPSQSRIVFSFVVVVGVTSSSLFDLEFPSRALPSYNRVAQ